MKSRPHGADPSRTALRCNISQTRKQYKVGSIQTQVKADARSHASKSSRGLIHESLSYYRIAPERLAKNAVIRTNHQIVASSSFPSLWTSSGGKAGRGLRLGVLSESSGGGVW